MKKPEVDYREFRLSRLNEERFSHLKLLWGWVVYFVLFFLTENLIPAENCYPVHIPLDDMIPFTEVFVIPYALWYLLVVWSLVYFALYNVDNFKNLQTYIIITQVFAMTAYILFPTRQDLRPEVFARDNIFTQIVGFIYSMDTNTGVCPSLHVAYSIGIASTWLREKSVSAVSEKVHEGLCHRLLHPGVFVHCLCQAAFRPGRHYGDTGLPVCRVVGISQEEKNKGK